MKYLAILRGINVSGKNIIKMDALRTMMEKIDFQNITTYIQSGNICFESNLESTFKITEIIKNGIQVHFNLNVPVLVFNAKEFDSIIKGNPFAKQSDLDVKFMHITFLENEIDRDLIPHLEEKRAESEQVFCQGKAVYLYLPTGYGNTKLSNNFIEKKLKNLATTRNWKTCLELQSLNQ
ncbi:MAG: DUF1697 domain-containing protein [Flavobacteriales bacterium]|nr:DUF1697 domain-containing protein [Flavobacteriales bacterium]